MALGRTAKLNTGAEIPLLGIGTYLSKENDAYKAVLAALKAGYRHIDTAYAYQNEKEVGQAIRDSGVPREEIFVTTKLWNTFHRPELVAKGVQESLDNLNIGYIDLLLMHWSVAFQPSSDIIPKGDDGEPVVDTSVDFTETYAAMEKLVGDKVRAIGVSNFGLKNLDKLLKTAKIVPAVNQVEAHPHFPQYELLNYCNKHNIHLTAWGPLGLAGAPLVKDDKVVEIANKYNKTPAQVLLSWGIQRGTSVIPKSVTESRIIENFQDFILEDEDKKTLDTLKSNPERLIYPWKKIPGLYD